MTEPRSSGQQVAIYLLLVFAFSSIFYCLMLKSSLAGGGGMYVLGIMWCPALAALSTLKLNGRSLTDLGWKWPATKYALASWYIPLLYAGIAYAIIWLAGFGAFPNREFMQSLVGRMGFPKISPALATVLYILIGGTFGMARGLASALGEEIGWRGFLVPQLFKTCSFTTTAILSGLVWSVWHYPLLIWGSYNGGTPTWYSLSCFTVMVVAISFVFAWMRLKSGSLWTAALLHASHNLYIQAMFTPLTRDTGKTAWFVDEFGAVVPLVAIAFAIYFWTRRKELSAATANAAAA